MLSHSLRRDCVASSETAESRRSRRKRGQHFGKSFSWMRRCGSLVHANQGRFIPLMSTKKFIRSNTLSVTAAIAVVGIALVYVGRRDALQIADQGSVNLPLPRDFTNRIIY